MSSAAPQTNGVPASSPGSSQTANNTTNNNSSQSQNPPPAAASQPQPTTNGVSSAAQPSQTQAPSSAAPQAASPAVAPAAAPPSPTVSAPKPRDQRTIELLLNAQGVTAFESRVPQLLLDFAYRHTSSVLSDSLYLSADPYVTHAGAKPSASSGATASLPGSGGDATVSVNAIKLAISSRLAYQFHGGGGNTGGGGISKDALGSLAAEKNKIALPKIPGNEWGIRLPNERFVMTGIGWGMREVLCRGGDDSDQEDEEDMADAMDITMHDDMEIGGDGVEGGTMEDMFGNEQVGEEDVDMGGAD